MAANPRKSKRRSAASSGPKQPDDTVFFIDRCLGRIEPAGTLKRAGIAIELHDDHLPMGAKDHEWLRLVAKKRWVALTKDKSLLHNESAKQLMKDEGARVFFLTRQELTGKQMGAIFTQALRRITNVARSNENGVMAQIFSDGKVKTVWVSPTPRRRAKTRVRRKR